MFLRLWWTEWLPTALHYETGAKDFWDFTMQEKSSTTAAQTSATPGATSILALLPSLAVFYFRAWQSKCPIPTKDWLCAFEICRIGHYCFRSRLCRLKVYNNCGRLFCSARRKTAVMSLAFQGFLTTPSAIRCRKYCILLGLTDYRLNPLGIPYHNIFSEINTHLKYSICSGLWVQM